LAKWLLKLIFPKKLKYVKYRICLNGSPCYDLYLLNKWFYLCIVVNVNIRVLRKSNRIMIHRIYLSIPYLNIETIESKCRSLIWYTILCISNLTFLNVWNITDINPVFRYLQKSFHLSKTPNWQSNCYSNIHRHLYFWFTLH
jgi:hypothetical protein